MTKATVIADSKNEFGQRITTFIITFPRYLLAEFNTHRMLSRNSASSRAIRFEKIIQSVEENPFIPLRWQKDHPGMQGTEYFNEEEIQKYQLVEKHLKARDFAVQMAKEQAYLEKLPDDKWLGVTKQIINRYLEPFMYHTALVTGTEWENFFALRAHEAAEIHFQDLAEKMLVAINESEPKQLEAGEWHIPFGDKFDTHDLYNYLSGAYRNGSDNPIRDIMIKLATVACAKVSYLTHDKESTIEKDIALHDRLASSGHWSAFEHCARAMSADEYEQFAVIEPREWLVKPQKYFTDVKIQGVCGNFTGFIQYRKMFPTENRQDSRLIKK